MQAKIRDAQAQQVPYMLVVGDRDQQAGTVSVRDRRQGDLGPQPLAEFPQTAGGPPNRATEFQCRGPS